MNQILHNKKGQFVKGDPALVKRNKTKGQRIAVGKARKEQLAEKGFIFSQKSQRKATKTRKKLGIGFQKGNTLGSNRKGSKATIKTIENLSQSHKGLFAQEKHPNWKGGITLLAERIRHSFKYRQWKSDVFMRDNFTCQKTGKRGGELNAHHIKPFAIILKENNIATFEEAMKCEELWNINNGLTLCKNYHDKIRQKYE